MFCVGLWRNCHAAPEPLRYAQICLICSTPISGLSNWPIHANGSKHMPLARISGGLSTNKQRIDRYSCRHFFCGIHWVHSKNANFNICGRLKPFDSIFFKKAIDSMSKIVIAHLRCASRSVLEIVWHVHLCFKSWYLLYPLVSSSKGYSSLLLLETNSHKGFL